MVGPRGTLVTYEAISDALTDEQAGERRVGVLELFVDLVFVLAITQVTAYLAAHLNWLGVAQGLVILGLMWWAWVGYSWLTNSVDSDDVSIVALGAAGEGAIRQPVKAARLTVM